MSRFLSLILLIPYVATATDPTSYRDDLRQSLLTEKARLMTEIPSFSGYGGTCMVLAGQYRNAVADQQKWEVEVEANNGNATISVAHKQTAENELFKANARAQEVLASAVKTGADLDAAYDSAYAIHGKIHEIDREIAKLDSRIVGLPVTPSQTPLGPLQVSESTIEAYDRLFNLPPEFNPCKRNRNFYEDTLASLASR